MLRANKAKRDKIKTIDLEMASRFLISDIYTKKQNQISKQNRKYVRRKQFKEES